MSLVIAARVPCLLYSGGLPWRGVYYCGSVRRTGQLYAVADWVAFMLGTIVAVLRKDGWLYVAMLAIVAADTGSDELVAEKERKKWLPNIPRSPRDFW